MTWDGRFDDDEAASNECPPNGKYLVEIIEAERGTSKGGDGMISVRLKIAEGPHETHTIFDNFMMTGRGAGIGKAKAKAFGVSLNKGDQVDESDFIGRRAYCYGRQEKYKGFTNLKSDIEHGDYCGYDSLSEDPDEFDDIPF
jgi:hypothetical protein